MNRILKYILLDILRNKIIIAYTLLLLVVSWSIFSLENNSAKGLLSLLNLVLLTVPLVTIMFTTVYVYNSSEFIELLLSQPLKRNKIWRSLFGGLSLAFATAYLIGIGIPALICAPGSISLMLIVCGVLISLVFVALAMLSAILSRDKAKGIGIAIVIWIFFAIIFDGIVLFLLFQFSDYPIEKAMIGITTLNPITLARILILLHMDVSAIMGYTGAIFKDFFGTYVGISVSVLLLLLWVYIPYRISLRLFMKRDN